MSCMACIPIVPIARGRRRAMGSTSIDGDDDVVDEEDEGPSMMDGRGLGDDEDEARGRDGRHHRHHIDTIGDIIVGRWTSRRDGRGERCARRRRRMM